MTDFERYIRHNHTGRLNAVSSKELEEVFGICGAELRATVNKLRREGVAICSCLRGYYYAANKKDIEDTLNHLERRAKSILDAKDGMTACLKRYPN